MFKHLSSTLNLYTKTSKHRESFNIEAKPKHEITKDKSQNDILSKSAKLIRTNFDI